MKELEKLIMTFKLKSTTKQRNTISKKGDVCLKNCCELF